MRLRTSIVAIVSGLAVLVAVPALQADGSGITLRADVQSSGAVELSWTPVAGAKAYAVYRYVEAETGALAIEYVRGSRHRDATLDPRENYRFVVAPLDANGEMGPRSNHVDVPPLAVRGREFGGATDAGAGRTSVGIGGAGNPGEDTSNGTDAGEDVHETPPVESSCDGVQVTPATDLQVAIDAHPQGATFCLSAGTYRLTAPLVPKSGQRLVSIEPRTAVLSGDDTTTMAVNGEQAADVELRGLIIERFATPIQNGLGAVKASRGWVLTDNEIRGNRGLGIYHESQTTLIGNAIHHNAWYGIGGFKAHGSRIENNEVFENGGGGQPNNGGSKWARTVDLVIRGNHFHHNYSNAIWVDGDNLDVTIEDNISSDNYGKGIHYEISCAGVIRNNVVERNETSGLSLVASRDVEVYGNDFVDNGHGILVWHQDRGEGANCPWSLANVRIHDNVVRMSGKQYSGLQTWENSDGDSIFTPSDTRVQFADNHYRVLDESGRHFLWNDALQTWQQWQELGHDVAGELSYGE